MSDTPLVTPADEQCANDIFTPFISDKHEDGNYTLELSVAETHRIHAYAAQKVAQHVRTLETKLRRYEQTLKFYANLGDCGRDGVKAFERDRGQRATAALKDQP